MNEGMHIVKNVTLTDRERRAILRCLHNARPREDLIGQLLLLGAGEELGHGNDPELVNLVRKLTEHDR